MTEEQKPNKVITLFRLPGSREDGTFGVMCDEPNYRPFAVTVEPPKNSPGRYLLKAGEHMCFRRETPSYGVTFEIVEEGHTDVLFHWGNTYINTKACVVVAEKFGILNDMTAVLESRNQPGEGFLEFLKVVEGLDQFVLNIVEVKL